MEDNPIRLHTKRKSRAVAIFGAGYVGSVTGAVLAESGHRVTILDVSEVKLHAIRNGEPPVAEPGLGSLIRQMVSEGRLTVSKDVEGAVRDGDVSIVCVGTPSNHRGAIDLTYVKRVCGEIGMALKARGPGHVVVVRSTVVPGTMADLVKPTLEKASGKSCGKDFHLVFNPEFLRESTAISDYKHPPKIVVGANEAEAVEVVWDLYEGIGAPRLVVAPEVAELVKYTDNAWHALKIVFGNEIGEICRRAGVDSGAVMDVFVTDRQLNISPAYLKPGFAFGGSCLPKDLRALLYFARHKDADLPVLEQVLRSNDLLIENVFRRILNGGYRKVGMYGLSFKANTDDLRESPLVLLAERFIGKGIDLRIFDENIQVDKLTGSNREYVFDRLPHFVDLLVESFEDLETFGDVVIIGHATSASKRWITERSNHIRVFDLVRAWPGERPSNYEGVSW